MTKRVFLIILDSLGIGALPDARSFGDEGSNTLDAISRSPEFFVPNMHSMGLFNIDGVLCEPKAQKPTASFGRMVEQSNGKDTTIGHWELSGIISENPLPTYPNGFPSGIIEQFEEITGRRCLCNKPYSGTKVIRDYGREHIKTGSLIVYTSADSVFQIAAHEDVVLPEKLYEYCRMARELLQGQHGVGRVIARPFRGRYPNYYRTSNRHDFSLQPPQKTMLDVLCENGLETIAVGKINDIFAGRGISQAIATTGNVDGMEKTIGLLDKDFKGLCFVNLVDFDMLYGHRNDVEGYAKAASVFDNQLAVFIENMKKDDVLIITADHGCDPSTDSTDHSREYVPILVYGHAVSRGNNLGTRDTFADVGATVLDLFSLDIEISGKSFKNSVIKATSGSKVKKSG
ncbi:MAG: phosphopentomutase [Clostridiales bacterium]|nr:phosphopentomutase [Clostridiales bacterium]